MNIEHNPQLTQFLQQLGESAEPLFCPICGAAIQRIPDGQSRISALCDHCDFQATVFNARKA